MRDQCVGCALRGDFAACVAEPCGAHDGWYCDQLRVALATAERDKREALEQELASDRCSCLCGCPLHEHEGSMDDGEQCEHEDHECLRVAPAVLGIADKLRAALDAATRERDEYAQSPEEAEAILHAVAERDCRCGLWIEPVLCESCRARAFLRSRSTAPAPSAKETKP